MTTLRALGSLAKDSLIYGFAGMVTRFLSVFLVPLYTRALSPSDFGLMAIVQSTVALLSVFVVLALDNSAARWYYDAEDVVDRKTTFSTWTWTYLVTASATGLVLFLLSGFLAQALLDTNHGKELFQIAAATVPAAVLGQVLFMWLRVRRRAWAAVTYTLGTSIVTIASTLVLVVVMNRGVVGVFLAQLIGAGAGSLIAAASMRSWLAPRWFRWDRLALMLRFALPLIPAALAYWIINLSDRYFLSVFTSKTEVGLYQVAYAVASAVYLVTAAFQMAWGPFAFSIYEDSNAREVYARTLLAYTWVTCLVASGISVLAPEALYLLATPRYSGAALAVPLLAFSYVVYGLSYIAAVGPGIVKTTKPVAAAVGLAAMTNLALNALLIPRFGIVGAGWSTLLSFAVMTSYLFLRSQALYPIRYRFSTAIVLVVSSLALSIAVGHWQPPGVWLGVIAKLGLLAMFLPAAFAIGLLTGADAWRIARSLRFPSRTP